MYVTVLTPCCVMTVMSELCLYISYCTVLENPVSPFACSKCLYRSVNCDPYSHVTPLMEGGLLVLAMLTQNVIVNSKLHHEIICTSSSILRTLED